MFNKSDIELKVAEFLLQIKAIKLQPNNPFTWASGWKSPIYCDNRVTLSHPSIRTYIRQKLTQLVQEEYGSVDLIVGVATAGIPQGALVAQELGLPFAYVRAKAKEHGTGSLIEGEIVEGQRVVLVEDLISTGKSSLAAVAALRDAGLSVAGLVSIFTYGFDVAEENFKAAKCRYTSLSNYETLIDYASEHSIIAGTDIELLKKWRENPAEWGR
ncbi:orotate phosphoribosyltransferase [Pedobacter quisquiliarum]|jgi:orotate phosphoribosyltransferase|uniref:Orotate phosphoribosyltransferase n=1 Tax=Pedobacter quisquiliarum TaxID=1834438 RepID=A0A916UFR9_9SPHI|nr:orotate phosphoribosyltransferase [Pedobacter quisquiliarum]GGC71164.1 orotate phosphoribosyltransferase [Pedobacter quisquiliarum]